MELLHEIPDTCPKQHATTCIGNFPRQTSENLKNLGSYTLNGQTWYTPRMINCTHAAATIAEKGNITLSRFSMNVQFLPIVAP